MMKQLICFTALEDNQLLILSISLTIVMHPGGSAAMCKLKLGMHCGYQIFPDGAAVAHPWVENPK